MQDATQLLSPRAAWPAVLWGDAIIFQIQMTPMTLNMLSQVLQHLIPLLMFHGPKCECLCVEHPHPDINWRVSQSSKSFHRQHGDNGLGSLLGLTGVLSGSLRASPSAEAAGLLQAVTHATLPISALSRRLCSCFWPRLPLGCHPRAGVSSACTFAEAQKWGGGNARTLVMLLGDDVREMQLTAT